MLKEGKCMLEIVINHSEANQKIFKFVKKYLNNAPLSLIYNIFFSKDFIDCSISLSIDSSFSSNPNSISISISSRASLRE